MCVGRGLGGCVLFKTKCCLHLLPSFRRLHLSFSNKSTTPQGGTAYFSDVLPSGRYLRAILSVTLSDFFSCFSILSNAYLFYPFFFLPSSPITCIFSKPPTPSYIGLMAPTCGSCSLELGGILVGGVVALFYHMALVFGFFCLLITQV